MKPHQERVVVEKEELDVKLNALDKFLQGDLFKSLSDCEQSRLRWQRMLMKSYSEVLHDRINYFVVSG